MEHVLITGGTSGLGRSTVEALLAKRTAVTVLARDEPRLAELRALGATVRSGDATDRATMIAAVAEVQPTTLVLNAGATPVVGDLDQLSWDEFERVWATDVKATLHGIQAAFAGMGAGSRVLAMSSGAARVGAPLSGSYAGAKRTIWLMARDANGTSEQRGLGIQFAALLPMQLMIGTPLGRTVASEYARRRGVAVEAYAAERYGTAMTPLIFGERVADWLLAPRVPGTAFGVAATGVTAIPE